MKTTITSAVLAIALAAGLASGSFAASKMATRKAAVKAPVQTTTLACKIVTAKTKTTVELVNTGTKDVAAGTKFTYTLFGPKLRNMGTYALPWALGPKMTLNLTKPMPAGRVTKCVPAA